MAEMIAVCAATGGTGRTILSTNIAVLLAARGKKVVAVDGDLQFGDLSMAMDINPSRTIAEAVGKKEGQKYIEFCQEHESGVLLLSAPTRPEYADLVTEADLERMIPSLKEESDYLIVETMAGLNDRSLPFLEQADHILIVTTGGMAALKNTKLMLETLETLDLRSRTSIIVNRSTSLGAIKANDLPELLETNRVFYLSNDFKHVSYSLESGKPLVTHYPTLEISKAIIEITEELFPKEGERELFEPEQNFFQKAIQQIRERRKK